MANPTLVRTPNTNILVAEDSPTQAQQLHQFLTRHGYSVTIAPDGRQALAAALDSNPAVIITDVVMPEMDGFQLCAAVKGHDDLKDIAVILLTSLTRPEDILKGLDCGADSFVRKPYEESYLLSRIDFILTNRMLRSAERLQVGLQLHFGGSAHFITAEKQQMLDLLISTYEDAVRINQELESKRLELASERDALAERTRQLAAANRDLESFSYAVSHDLRAPLRHISGLAGIVMEDHGSELSAEVKSHLERIQDRVLKMGRMIDDLLNLSRLDRSEIQMQTISLPSLVEEVVQELKADAAGRQIEWKIAPLPSVRGDPGLVRQVFANLLSNAVKYTRPREHTIIEIGTTTSREHQMLYVRDNGVGFDPKHASRLFVPFQRLHSEKEFEGVGVGLATVQRIVRKHGGEVSTEAEVGKGATFYFSLPGC
jgi:two-component system, sensor histidine kinase and response regulator